jgi:hypothetical protein
LEDRLTPNTYTVTNLNDGGPGSLRDAINQANMNPGPDLVSFAGGLKGTIYVNDSDIAITDPLTIQGVTDGHQHPSIHVSSVFSFVTFSSPRIFDVQSTTVSISGLQFDNGGGDGGGGIRSFASSVNVSDSVFNHTGTLGNGGAIASSGGGSLSVNHSLFSQCIAQGNDAPFSVGGAIWNGGGSTLVVNDSQFVACEAFDAHVIAEGGAIGNGLGYDTRPEVAAGSVTITNCLFAGNEALGSGLFSDNFSVNAEGGALYNGMGGSMTVSNCDFGGNQAQAGTGRPVNGNVANAFGGAIMNNEFFTPGSTATLSVDHCLFSRNEASGSDSDNAVGGPGAPGGIALGGAIDEEFATMTITNTTFRGNLAVGGAGGNGDVGFNGGDGGQGNGGGVRAARNSTLNISDSGFFDFNDAQAGFGGNGGAGANGGRGGDAFGGDIDVTHNSTATVLRCTLQSGQVGGGIGGIGGDHGTGGDGGRAMGGGINANNDSTLTVTNSFIAGCEAFGGFGGGGTDSDMTGGGNGGNAGDALGGGIALVANVNGGIAKVTGTTIAGCSANGGLGGGYVGSTPVAGVGGNGGNGLGGGIYSGPLESLQVLGGSLISNNQANGGAGGIGNLGNGATGLGLGGGLFIDPMSNVVIQSNVLIKNNHATTAGDDIYGMFIVI